MKKAIFILTMFSMCRNLHNERDLLFFKCDMPEINKTLVFNSPLKIKEVRRKKLYFNNDIYASYYFLDSLKKIIAEIWVKKNSCLSSIGYENYISHEIHYQQLFQEKLYSESKNDFFPHNFFSYSFLKTKKGNLLAAKYSLNPDTIPEKIVISMENEIESFRPDKNIFSTNIGFQLDSLEISFSIFTTPLDTSKAQIEKILVPIVNTLKIY